MNLLTSGIAQAMRDAMPGPARWLPPLLLTATLAIAADQSRLEIGGGYEDLLTDEIYRQAEGWRAPPAFESEWRAPREKDSGRIRFGYDSVYEEQRARQQAGRPVNDQMNLREPTPNTLLRWSF